MTGCVEIPTATSGGIQQIPCTLAYSLPYFGPDTYYYRQTCTMPQQANTKTEARPIEARQAKKQHTAK